MKIESRTLVFQDPIPRLAEARHRLALAELAEEKAWGSTDGKTAKPQGVQLAMRIELGEFLLAGKPGDPAILAGLAELDVGDWRDALLAILDAADGADRNKR